MKSEEIENKILELNRKMERIRLQCNNPTRDPDYMYMKGIREGINIGIGSKML